MVWFGRGATKKGVHRELILSLFEITKGLVKYHAEFLGVIGTQVFLLVIHNLY
jgi:hypothetical protein